MACAWAWYSGPLFSVVPSLIPGDLGQQVGPAVSDLLKFRHARGFLGLVHGTPPGMALGDARQPGDEQAVGVRSGTITSHLANIEHEDDKRKVAELVSVLWPAGKEPAMEALTPASPDSCRRLGSRLPTSRSGGFRGTP
jgi:hypothetical protein